MNLELENLYSRDSYEGISDWQRDYIRFLLKIDKQILNNPKKYKHYKGLKI